MKPSKQIINRAPKIGAGYAPPNASSYLPSNGSEGDIFEAHWCSQCKHEDADNYQFCSIHDQAFCDDTPPDEWIYWAGCPLCTAFEPNE